MAERVQRHLEEMMEVFEVLERLQLFSHKEIKQVIKRCKNYEYRLQKPAKKKHELLQYIQYLIAFKSLVHYRRKMLKVWQKKLEVATFLGEKISALFRLGCHRFPSDEKLWLSRIEFVKQRKMYVTASKLYMKMLKVLNARPELWILAAKWEFEGNASAENARHILQRALRFHPDNRQLWLELFKFELLYIEKVKKRLEILQNKTNETADEVPDAILSGKLALLVYEKATEAVDDAGFCVQLLSVSREFPFASDISDKILDHLSTCYPRSEERFVALVEKRAADEQFSAGEGSAAATANLPIFRNRLSETTFEHCCELFEQGVSEVSTPKMWEHYLRYCMKALPAPFAKVKCLAVFDRAAASDALDVPKYIAWASMCSDDSAKSAVLKHAVDKHPDSAEAWELYLNSLITSEAPECDIEKAFRKSVREVPQKEQLDLWRCAAMWYLMAKPDQDFEEFLESGIFYKAPVSTFVRRFYLEWAWVVGGVQKLREVYKRLSSQKPNELTFYLDYMEILEYQFSRNSDEIRNCYEDMLEEHGSSNVDLWVQYIRFESEHKEGDVSRVAFIHKRAIQRLMPELVQDFIQKITLYKAGKLSKDE